MQFYLRTRCGVVGLLKFTTISLRSLIGVFPVNSQKLRRFRFKNFARMLSTLVHWDTTTILSSPSA